MGGEPDQEKADAVVVEDPPEDGEKEDLKIELGSGDEEEIDPQMAAVLKAAESGDLQTLCSLFEQVEVDARGEDGDSPLHIACLYGQVAVVEECIRRGADVNVKDEDDSTPLHDACAGGFESIVAQLLQKGASVTAKDSEEETPIHHAARGGHAAVVQQLLTASSDRAALLQQPNAAGERAADLADNDAVRALLG